MTIVFDLFYSLILSIICKFFGMFLGTKFSFLTKYSIPNAISGGLLGSAILTLLSSFGITCFWDESLKETMMLGFFASVGLGIDFQALVTGGKKTFLFLGLASLVAVLQNILGLIFAKFLSLPWPLGLLTGSSTMTGGHGTGLTWAHRFPDVYAASEVAAACATMGLILGGIVGGPVAQLLIKRHGLKPNMHPKRWKNLSCSQNQEEKEVEITLAQALLALLLTAICVAFGKQTSQLLTFVALPKFFCVMLWGTGFAFLRFLRKSKPLWELNPTVLELMGGICLTIFLAMAMMTMNLSLVFHMATPIILIISAQTLLTAAFAYYITFPLMGKDYDAAMLSAGQCGFNLGALPTAIANMEALAQKHGPSPQSILIISLVGAFLIDMANTGILEFFTKIMS